MDISGENKPSLASLEVMGTRKFGIEMKPKRRVLGEINQNLIGAQIHNHVVNKKVHSGTHQNCDISLPNPSHHAITRKFATEKSATSDQNFTVYKDVEIADVEEIKDQMEIDDEGLFNESVMDIDGCDAENLLAVVEYVDDLYAYYKKMEIGSCVSPTYMAHQCHINDKMRGILIDWLIEVHHKFDLRDETLFLTVNLIDRFLSQKGVVRKKLQLIGLVALLLASKYEEVSPPIVDDLVYISDKAYTRKDILDMEKLMLNTLQFNMSLPTAYVFMNRYLKAAQSDRKLELLSFFLIELCFVEYKMLKYEPSFLATCAIYTAQCTLFGFKKWSKTSKWHTSYSEDQLLECSKLIVSFHQRAATGRLTGVYRKYCTVKFDCVAKIEPANFLLKTG